MSFIAAPGLFLPYASMRLLCTCIKTGREGVYTKVSLDNRQRALTGVSYGTHH